MGIAATLQAHRPRLAVRVGVTGHRALPELAANEIRERIGSVLGLIESGARAVLERPDAGYTSESPLLRAISPLAEGGDRLFARAALELGWELQCPLPFKREEYVRDFHDLTSRSDFEALLQHPRTTAIVELDGERSAEPLAYQAVGRLMLEQSDLLVAIWNGRGPEGRGGTAQIVDEAIRQGIPTIWIQAEPPHSIRLLLCMETKPGCLVEPERVEERLSEAMVEILLHRAKPGGVKTHALFERDEAPDPREESSLLARKRASLLGRIWSSFLRFWSKGVSVREAPANPDGPYRPLYEYADAAAQYFFGLYRGSFLTNYLLGVCAVLSALLAYAHRPWHTFWVLVELAAIGSILALITVAKVERWHEPAIDYRYLAEQFRQMLFLHPLGRVTPSSRPPAHYTFGDPRSTWMNWRFRAFVRQIGMPGPALRMDRDALHALFELVRRQWIPSQIHYHRDNSTRLHTIEHRLHWTAKAFFFATIASCLSHLLVHDPVVVPWLTFLSAGLPTFGAALHAISSHGEFRRLAERSGAMAAQLELTIEELDLLAQDPQGLRSSSLGRTVSEVAQTMIDEVSDWRIVYRKPPLEPV